MIRDFPAEPDPTYEPVDITESLICAEILRQHGQEVIRIMTPDEFEDRGHPDYNRFDYIVESGVRSRSGHFTYGYYFGVNVANGQVVSEEVALWQY